MFIIVFSLGSARPSGLPFFSVNFTSFHSHSYVLTFFVCFLTLFHFAVPMRECLRKHSCKSSPFPIAILNGILFFRETS